MILINTLTAYIPLRMIDWCVHRRRMVFFVWKRWNGVASNVGVCLVTHVETARGRGWKTNVFRWKNGRFSKFFFCFLQYTACSIVMYIRTSFGCIVICLQSKIWQKRGTWAHVGSGDASILTFYMIPLKTTSTRVLQQMSFWRWF